MENYFKNKFNEINIDKSKNYAEFINLETTEDFSPEEYKQNTLITVDCFKKFLAMNINLFLFDARLQKFLITTELQIWTAEQFMQFANYEYKTATLLSEDYLTGLAVEQATEEFANLKQGAIVNKFFANKELAVKWLME